MARRIAWKIWGAVLSTLAVLGVSVPSRGEGTDAAETRRSDPAIIQESKKPMLFLEQLNDKVSSFLLAGHRSHSSHRSHASHASHASHYSGSGSYTPPASTPSYTPPPASTPPPATYAPSPTVATPSSRVAYLKSGVYERRVLLQSPEKNRLATEFAKKGIAVVGSEELKPFFTFEGTQESEGRMIIDINYRAVDGSEKVGSYYLQGQMDEAFVIAFTKWFIANAWVPTAGQ